MTSALYLLDDGALDGVAVGARLVLDGDEGRHAATVRRTRSGERVDVADGGRVARCTVTQVGTGRLDLSVEAVVDIPVRLPRLVLVQALAKGGRDELAVETATELGVDAVVPWQADRSIVVWSGERGERSRRKWESVARAAAKQSRRPRVPLVEPALTSTRLAGRVRDVTACGGAALVLHEDAERSLSDAVLPVAGELLVVVGPEGGIGADELDGLVTAGAHAVRLGPEVLRTSSAGAAALAVLSVRVGRWT
jgi:16S rRNA (uracil1498-N3)-methyltransferase